MFPNGPLRVIGSLLPTLCFHLWSNQYRVCHPAYLTTIFTFQALITITMLLMSLIFNLPNLSSLPDLQTPRALKTQRKDIYFFLEYLIVILFNSFLSAIRYVAGWDTSRTIFWNSSAWMEGVSIKHNRPAADARCMNHTIDVEIVWEGLFSVSHVSSKAMLSIHSIKSRYVFFWIVYHTS
jgi:hypothetical protein